MGRDDVEVRAFALIFQAARFERFLVGLVDVVVVVVLEQNVPREGTTTFITFITTPACVDCEGLELQQTFPAAAAAAPAERFLREPRKWVWTLLMRQLRKRKPALQLVLLLVAA